MIASHAVSTRASVFSISLRRSTFHRISVSKFAGKRDNTVLIKLLVLLRAELLVLLRAKLLVLLHVEFHTCVLGHAASAERRAGAAAPDHVLI